MSDPGDEMFDHAGYPEHFGQRERPPTEQLMPQWHLDALDRARALVIKNARENPAICTKLDRIEGKMDEILALLKSGGIEQKAT